MSTKHEWRKKEKELYLPKGKPELVEVPKFNFITIQGKGSPAEESFTECISTLYAVAYGIKMIPKKMSDKPPGYFDFTVYPLEGVWDINDEAKKHFSGTINKADLVYNLMIRQPDFVDNSFFRDVLNIVKEKKLNPMLDAVKYESISEGKCVQMLHLGKFENEPITFEKMENFARENGLKRLSKVHREIYLSDARRVEPSKLKTVLRFKV